jgi:hypothetical protein
MPTLSILALIGALIVLMLPLLLLEYLSDAIPRLHDYKGWLSVLIWLAAGTVIYFVVAPVLGLRPAGY